MVLFRGGCCFRSRLAQNLPVSHRNFRHGQRMARVGAKDASDWGRSYSQNVRLGCFIVVECSDTLDIVFGRTLEENKGDWCSGFVDVAAKSRVRGLGRKRELLPLPPSSLSRAHWVPLLLRRRRGNEPCDSRISGVATGTTVHTPRGTSNSPLYFADEVLPVPLAWPELQVPLQPARCQS